MKPFLSIFGSADERAESPLAGLPVIFPNGTPSREVETRGEAPGGSRSMTMQQFMLGFGDVALGGGIVSRTEAWKNPHVRACVEANAQAVANLPFVVFSGDQPLKTHWWLDFVQHPNDALGLSEHDLKMQTAAIRELFGETFWILEREGAKTLSGKRAPLSAIWPYHPHAVTEVLDRRTGELLAWEITFEQQKFRVDPLDVIHFKRYDPMRHNPLRPARGTSPLDAAMLAVSTDIAASRYNLDFFTRGVAPGVVFSSKGDVDADDGEKFIAKIKGKLAGKNGEPIYLSGDEWEVHQLSTSQKDAEYAAGKLMAMREICEVFKTPPCVVGNQDQKYDNAEMQLLLWYDGPLMSIQTSICDGINLGLLRKEQGVRCYLDTKVVEVLQKRQRERFAAAAPLHDKGVPWDVLDRRFDLGLGKFPGSDVAFVAYSQVPVDMITETVINDPKPEAGTTTPHQPSDPVIVLDDEPERMIRIVTGSATRADETDELTRLVLEIIRGDDEKLQKLAKKFYLQAVEVGAKQIRDLVSMETVLSIDDPRVVRFLEEKTNQIVSVNKTTADRIMKSIVAGVEAGTAHEEIAREIKELYNLRDRQARLIARQETGSSLNGGRYMQMSEEDVQRHEWLSSRDDRVRDSHKDLDGQVVEVGETFSNGLEYPQDPNGDPAETIGCRCITLPAPSTRSTRAIDKDEYWKRAIGSVRTIESGFNRKLQAYLYDQRKRVLAAVAEVLK